MEINYCASCSSRVSSVDLEQGGGLTTDEGKILCRACARKLGIKVPKKGKPSSTTKPGLKRPVRQTAPKAPSSNSIIIILVIVVMLMALLMGLLFVTRKDSTQIVPKPDTIPIAEEPVPEPVQVEVTPQVQPAPLEKESPVPMVQTKPVKPQPEKPQSSGWTDIIRSKSSWTQFSPKGESVAVFDEAGIHIDTPGKKGQIGKTVNASKNTAFELEYTKRMGSLTIIIFDKHWKKIETAYYGDMHGTHTVRIEYGENGFKVLLDGKPQTRHVDKTVENALPGEKQIRIHFDKASIYTITRFAYQEMK